jgi:hypothetical protein
VWVGGVCVGGVGAGVGVVLVGVVVVVVLHSSSAGSPNSTVSLTKHFLFTVLPKTFLTVRHVLSIAALCREQEEYRAVSNCCYQLVRSCLKAGAVIAVIRIHQTR